CDANSFVHSNGGYTRGLFAQDVSDFHRKLLQVSRRGHERQHFGIHYTKCQRVLRRTFEREMATILTFRPMTYDSASSQEVFCVFCIPEIRTKKEARLARLF